MNTLAEVIANGEGIERPFNCEVHDDRSASASVNIAKGVWYCFACHAKGTTDGKNKAPSSDALASLLAPERAARLHPEAWLELFRNQLGVWPDRFPEWIRGLNDLGCDPFTLDATFPVHTPKGQLAGVGRRKNDPEAVPRYAYPPSWSASRSLFTPVLVHPSPVLVMVEGAADSCAVAEIGCHAAAVYGSGIHAPQIELIKRRRPKLVVYGFDADTAGERARMQAQALEGVTWNYTSVDWGRAGAKDPAALIPEERRTLLAEVVSDAGYGAAVDDWQLNADASQALWQRIKEER